MGPALETIVRALVYFGHTKKAHKWPAVPPRTTHSQQAARLVARALPLPRIEITSRSSQN
jgi:hypothetical protein